MPTVINFEEYNGLSSLRANIGDWVDAEVRFSNRFYVLSSTTNSFLYNTSGSLHTLTLQSGDLGEDYGFIVGDTITIAWTHIGLPPLAVNSQSHTKTITYINGNVIHLNSALVISAVGPDPNLPDGTIFPTTNYASAMSVTANKRPNAVEFQFNLIKNGGSSLNSVIDGELNRFELQDVDTLALATPTAMTQLTNKSGGLIKDVMLTYSASAGGGWYDFVITYTFFQWALIQDGFDEPQQYNLGDCVAPIIKIKSFSEYGNPLAVLEDTTETTEANTGGFGENYNGGVNNYEFQSIAWLDLNGASIDSMDYSNPCSFTAIVTAPNQNNPLSTYRLGMVWRPTDSSQFQNKPTSLGENLLLVAPETNFIADASVYAGPYNGYTHPDGGMIAFSNLSFELTGPTELTITGTVTPNAAVKTLMDTIPNGSRKMTMWVSLDDQSLTDITTDKVSLKLNDEDCIDAPTIGVQYPDVVDEFLYDHAGNDITSTLGPNTTTEDNVLYVSRFTLNTNEVYDGINTRIFAKNSLTGEEFTLETQFISFANVPYIAGVHEVNETIQRNFLLPTASDRNIISLTRDVTLDTVTEYGVQLDYGFLNDWRYWIENLNVDADFFDMAEPNNGLNNNWQMFSESGDWSINLGYYVRLNGVDDFQEYKFIIRDYEDDPTVTLAVTLRDEDDVIVTEFIQDQVMTISALFTWNQPFSSQWVEITAENYEGQRIGFMSSVLSQVNEPNNVLKPMAVGGAITVTLLGNTLTAKCKIDTNLVNVDEISLTYRVFSLPKDSDSIVSTIKQWKGAYSLRKISSNSVYPDTAPAIRVRRASDNAEQDIGFVASGSDLVLDEVSLLAFTGTDPASQGYIVKWYDQSDNQNDAVQTSAVRQPQIVLNGVVVVDPNNGKPAILFDSTLENYFVFDIVMPTSQVFYSFFKFNRTSIGTNSIGFANNDASNLPYVTVWNAANELKSGMGTENVHNTGQVATGEMLTSTLRNTSNNTKMWLNGVAKTTVTYANVADSITHLGRWQTLFHDGYMQECGFTAWDKEALRTAIEANINAFY